MGHLVPTGKKWFFGLPIKKPTPGKGRFTKAEGARIKQTQSELEKLHREQLLKRAKAKGERIRSKRRLSDSPIRRNNA